jgi:diadenosine tetraphosphatase ApaH/serine/threonine PP2A family protein phosphatase
VHSSLSCPREWGYILDYDAARHCFDLLSSRACFIGHSHVPIVFRGGDGTLTIQRSKMTTLDPKARYIVNVGSVGQPRDGDPRASYGVYDASQQTVEIRRVEYDIRSAQDKIIAAGLPEFLAVRLEAGR